MKYEPKLNDRQVGRLIDFLPNLAADLDKNQPVFVWREIKPQKNIVEFTLYYYTPNGYNGVQKKRIDFDITEEILETGIFKPEDCTITYWGPVERYSS